MIQKSKIIIYYKKSWDKYPLLNAYYYSIVVMIFNYNNYIISIYKKCILVKYTSTLIYTFGILYYMLV